MGKFYRPKNWSAKSESLFGAQVCRRKSLRTADLSIKKNNVFKNTISFF